MNIKAHFTLGLFLFLSLSTVALSMAEMSKVDQELLNILPLLHDPDVEKSIRSFEERSEALNILSQNKDYDAALHLLGDRMQFVTNYSQRATAQLDRAFTYLRAGNDVDTVSDVIIKAHEAAMHYREVAGQGKPILGLTEDKVQIVFPDPCANDHRIVSLLLIYLTTFEVQERQEKLFLEDLQTILNTTTLEMNAQIKEVFYGRKFQYLLRTERNQEAIEVGYTILGSDFSSRLNNRGVIREMIPLIRGGQSWTLESALPFLQRLLSLELARPLFADVFLQVLRDMLRSRNYEDVQLLLLTMKESHGELMKESDVPIEAKVKFFTLLSELYLELGDADTAKTFGDAALSLQSKDEQQP